MMDRAYVVREDIVERYVRGELNAEEAAAFEQFYLTDAETLDELDALLSLQEAGAAAFEPSSTPARRPVDAQPFWQRWFRPELAPMHLAAYAVLVAALCLGVLLRPQGPGAAEVTVLTLETQRSGSSTLTLDPAAAGRPVVLEIPVPIFSEETFSLTVSRQGKPVFSLAGLKPNASGLVNTFISPEVLQPGSYDIELRSGDEAYGQWRMVVKE